MYKGVNKFFKPDDILISVLDPILGIAIGSGIRYLVKKNKIKEDNTILYTVIAIVILYFYACNRLIYYRKIGEHI